MSDEQEEKIRAEEWGNEWFWDLDPLIDEQDLRIIMICMECGNPLEGCSCKDAVPTPPPHPRAFSTPPSESDIQDIEIIGQVVPFQ